jgi:hypothetical protein
MRNQQTNFMRWLFSQQDLPQMVAQSAAIHEDLRRMSAMGQAAIVHHAQMRAFALSLIPTPEMMKGFSQQLKSFVDAAAEDARQHRAVLEAFAGTLSTNKVRKRKCQIKEELPTIG